MAGMYAARAMESAAFEEAQAARAMEQKRAREEALPPTTREYDDLCELEDEQLLAMKADLEQRLARFQRAFFKANGRNPNEEELRPAKPAIRRYRLVCRVIAEREHEEACEYAEENTPRQGAARRSGAGGAQAKGAAGRAFIEQQAHQAVDQEGVGEAVGRALTRGATRGGKGAAGRAAAGGGDAAGAQAVNMGSASVSSSGGFLPSSAMTDLVISMGQYFQIFGDVMTTSIGSFGLTIPWNAPNLWPIFAVFNIDLNDLSLSFPDLAWLKSVGWREKHLGFTVALPLVISLVTILLLRSLADIAQLALFTVSTCLVIFGISAYIIILVAEGNALGLSSTSIGDTMVLGISSSTINTVMYAGAAGLVCSVVWITYKRLRTHAKVRMYLEREVDTLTEKLAETVDHVAHTRQSTQKLQESQLHTDDIREILEHDEQAYVGGRAESAEEFLRQMEDAHERRLHGSGPRLPKLTSFVKVLLVWMLVSLAALFLWLRVGRNLPKALLAALPDAYLDLMRNGAIVCSSLSGLILVYEFLTLFQGGQHFLDGVRHMLKSVYIGFLLILVSVFYIPISRQALSVFFCQRRVCDAGMWYPIASPGDGSDFWSTATALSKSLVQIGALGANPGSLGQCQECGWLSGPAAAGACPSELATRFCPRSESTRLVASMQIDCHMHWPFYIPGAILTALSFTLGVPYMYYHLIRQHTKMYSHLQVYESTASAACTAVGMLRHRKLRYSPDELEDQWARRVRPAGRNRAKNLYADFEFRWKYWKLVLLGQKFLIVVVYVLQSSLSSPFVAPALMLAIHLCMLCLTVYAQPYIDKRPDCLSLAISFANVFNWTLLLLAAADVALPESMIWAVLVVNLVFPILSLLFGWLLNKRKARKLLGATAAKGRKYVAQRSVQKQRRLVERSINEFTLRFLARWTWGVLLCAVIAAEAIFIGTFAEAAITPVRGHTSTAGLADSLKVCDREEHVRNLEFVGKGNWSAFTSDCCCMSRMRNMTLAPIDEHVTELWACSTWSGSTVYKERKRRPTTPAEQLRYPHAAGEKVSPVRAFCGTRFLDASGGETDAEPVWDEAAGKLGIRWAAGAGGAAVFHDDYW